MNPSLPISTFPPTKNMNRHTELDIDDEESEPKRNHVALSQLHVLPIDVRQVNGRAESKNQGTQGDKDEASWRRTQEKPCRSHKEPRFATPRTNYATTPSSTVASPTLMAQSAEARPPPGHLPDRHNSVTATASEHKGERRYSTPLRSPPLAYSKPRTSRPHHRSFVFAKPRRKNGARNADLRPKYGPRHANQKDTDIVNPEARPDSPTQGLYGLRETSPNGMYTLEACFLGDPQ
ncbi:hypothetical protein FDECE_16483 [Fusarium decemcellulare]|nr:hypothetical protein FDECE_16483 [Fusarium decemcellulare]